ncbi:MAG: hypothetical protein WAL71_00555 [Terriglobales bacterium]|jgi:hypothetical protein
MRRLCLLTLVFSIAALLTACGSSSSTPAPSAAPRTVTVSWVNTYWSPTGPVQVPEPDSAAVNIEALVPQSDNSITLLKASATSSPGVFTISSVPAGNYWLAAGGGTFLTNTSTFDAGRDYWGGQPPVTTTPSDPTFNFNISGIAADPNVDTFEFSTVPPSYSFSDQISPDSTSLTFSQPFGSTVDWTQIQNAFLMQYQFVTVGTLGVNVLGPELTLSNLTLTNGGPNAISGTLNPTTVTSLDLNVSGSQWTSLLNNVGPASATVEYSSLTLTAEPFVTGINAYSPGGITGGIGGVGISSLSSSPGGGVELFSTESVPPNQSPGTLQYGDPFDSTWTRPLTYYEGATIPLPVPNSSATYNFSLVDGESVSPSNSTIVPVALPVQNPTINGSSFFTANTADSTTPSLSWTAPTGTAPYGYRVVAYVLTTVNGAPAYAPAGTYNTAGTSVTLPPLAGGNTYIFTITTEVDGAANMQTSPFRSKLPTGFASVISAPITISASATTPQIDGDIEEWSHLVNLQSDDRANTHSRAAAHSHCAFAGNAPLRPVCE